MLGDVDISSLDGIEDYGTLCGIATNMLADGYEVEDVADVLRFDYGLRADQALGLAWLMTDEASEWLE